MFTDSLNAHKLTAKMITEELHTEFEEIFKAIIAPFFKSLKFRKKAHNFARTSNDIVQTFTVQKNLMTTSIDKLYFSFDFGFFNKDIYNITRDNDVTIDFPVTSDCFIQNPFGLYSHKRAHWYELSSRIDPQNVALSVKSDLDTYLKPLFSTYQSLEDLVRFTEIYEKNKLIVSPYEYIAFLMLSNQRVKGIHAIKDHYCRAMAIKVPNNTSQFPYKQNDAISSLSESKGEYLGKIHLLAKKYGVVLDAKEDNCR
jgi:hypothetical protein